MDTSSRRLAPGRHAELRLRHGRRSVVEEMRNVSLDRGTSDVRRNLLAAEKPPASDRSPLSPDPATPSLARAPRPSAPIAPNRPAVPKPLAAVAAARTKGGSGRLGKPAWCFGAVRPCGVLASPPLSPYSAPREVSGSVAEGRHNGPQAQGGPGPWRRD